MDYLEIQQKARQLDKTAKFVGGINWSWVEFTDGDAAQKFDVWCRRNGCETRGVYPPDGNNPLYGVRYR